MPHLQRRFLVCAFVLALVPRALADTAGPRVCTASSGTNWTNPTNVLANDANYAVYNNAGSNPMNVTTCGFSIPTDATVTGVQVRIIGCGTGSTAARRRIQANLLGAGTCTAKTTLNQALSTHCGGSGADTDQTVGATNDTWSCTALTASAVNATAFGVAITDNDGTANELDEQYVEITVTYAPATTTTSTTTTTTTTTVTTTTSSTTTTTLPPRKRYRSE